MKKIELSASVLLIAFFGIAVYACSPSVSTEKVKMELSLVGEMLFEGANSLQYSNENQLAEIAAEVGVDEEAVEGITVSEVTIELDDLTRPITESLLLQVVSDNQELVTIGTLNPLPEGQVFTLSLAETTSILKYLKDSGTTWVLDLNITEDYMDEMTVDGSLDLTIDYIPNKN